MFYLKILGLLARVSSS